MSDLLAEVDEAMRQEKLEKFWHENKLYIILFIALTILSAAATSGYRAWDDNVKTKQTAELLALQNASNYPNNILDANLEMRASLKGIVLLSAASAFMGEEKKDEAAQLYARLASDTTIPDDFRFLGILMDMRLKMDREEADKAVLLTSLDPILSSKSPWKPHAQIDAALLQAENNPDQAIELLNMVSDTPNLPPSLYERAQKLHHVIAGNQSSESSTKTN